MDERTWLFSLYFAGMMSMRVHPKQCPGFAEVQDISSEEISACADLAEECVNVTFLRRAKSWPGSAG